MIERLTRGGWARGQAPALHDATTARIFGQDKFATKKNYLQCLLAENLLRQRGLSALPSGQSSWYYRAVLSAERPAGVPRDGTAKVYKALVCGDGQGKEAAGDGGQGGRFAICDISASDGSSDSDDSMLPFSLPGALAREESAVVSDNDAPARLAAGPSMGPIGQSPDDMPCRPLRGASSSSSETQSISDDIGQEVVSFGPDGQLLPLIGARSPLNECIRVEEHLRPGTPGHYRRYTTVCPLARTGHCAVIACGKRRNCGASQMGSLGPAAPEAFLMVWREQASAFQSKAEHQRWSPTWAEVRRYMVAQGWSVGQ